VSLELETSAGAARVHLRRGGTSRGALVLGHGAGGGVGARDLVAVADAAVEAGIAVALVEQPYRVAGRRTPPRAPALDSAWTDVVERLREEELSGLPLVAGGRSSGARVACRTAGAVGAAGVLCLAFPLVPPGRGQEATRLPELEAVEVPVLVVQGEHDRFGIPPEAPSRKVVVVRGDHGLKSDLPAVAAAAREWLLELLPTPASAGSA
jgi:predicted alpha/beta-hydrolase family hydrolase